MKLTQPKKSELNAEIFGAEVNPDLIAQAVRVYRIKTRRGTRKTKGRGEVSGGGRKPWRQKGTGRARHGSIRSPIWVGGGHAHPIRPVNYKARLPKKMKREALFAALAARQDEGRIFTVDELGIAKPSTQEAEKVVDAWKLEGSVLLIVPKPDESLKFSVRNLPCVDAIEARQLSAYEVVRAENLVFVDDALKVIEETFL